MGYSYCCVPGCKTDTDMKHMSFFRIPNDEERARVWIYAIGRKDVYTRKTRLRNYKLCAKHFEPKMFVNKRLTLNAYPTLCLPPSSEKHNAAVKDEPQVDSVEAPIRAAVPTPQQCYEEPQNTSSLLMLELNCTTGLPMVSVESHFDPAFEVTSHTDLGITVKTEEVEDIDDSPGVSDGFNAEDTSNYMLVVPDQITDTPLFIPAVVKTESDPLNFTNQIDDAFASTSTATHFPDMIEGTKTPETEPKVFPVTRVYVQKPVTKDGNDTLLKRKLMNEAIDPQTKRIKSTGTPHSMPVTENSLLRAILVKNITNENSFSAVPENAGKKGGTEGFIEGFMNWLHAHKCKYNALSSIELMPFAINLYLCGPKTYCFLEKCLKLPSVAELRQADINFKTSVHIGVIKLLSMRLNKLPPNYKHCILCLDEMVLATTVIKTEDESSSKNDVNTENKTNGSVVVIAMLKGGVENFNQLLGYKIIAEHSNYLVLKSWIDDILNKLFNSGFDVWAVVTNGSVKFADLAKSIGVKVESPFFKVTRILRKVYYIFDVPHLMKSLRNHLLQCNLMLDKHVIVLWNQIVAFYKYDKERLIRMAPELTSAHIIPSAIRRKELRYVTELFSDTVAAGMSVQVELYNLPAVAKPTIQFISDINKTFNMLNSSEVDEPNIYKRAYSGTQFQKHHLQNARDKFRDMKAIDRHNGRNITEIISVTTTSWQITINSVLQLYDDIVLKGVKHLFTKRLHNDDIENFFTTIYVGTGSRKLNPVEFDKIFSKLLLDSLMNASYLKDCEDDVDVLFSLNSDCLLQDWIIVHPSTKREFI